MKKITLCILSILFIYSCSNKQENLNNNESPESFLSSEQIPELESQPIEYTEEQNLLIKVGIDPFTTVSENDLKLLKEGLDKGIFDSKSFCQFYKEYKDLEFKGDYKASDKVIIPLKKIKGLDLVLAVNGFKYCSKELKEVKGIVDYHSADNTCTMAEEFIKLDLKNPNSADFSIFNCSTDKNANNTYTILTKVSAKNNLGVEKDVIYKLTIGFKGGDKFDINNWDLKNIRSEISN